MNIHCETERGIKILVFHLNADPKVDSSEEELKLIETE